MTVKQAKSLIGTTIGLVPQSNAVHRGVPLKDQIREGVLLKVGRTNLTTDNQGKFNINGELDVYNYGYLPFPTKQDAIDHLTATKLGMELQNRSWNHLTLKQVQQIQEILDDSAI